MPHALSVRGSRATGVGGSEGGRDSPRSPGSVTQGQAPPTPVPVRNPISSLTPRHSLGQQVLVLPPLRMPSLP